MLEFNILSKPPETPKFFSLTVSSVCIWETEAQRILYPVMRSLWEEDRRKQALAIKASFSHGLPCDQAPSLWLFFISRQGYFWAVASRVISQFQRFHLQGTLLTLGVPVCLYSLSKVIPAPTQST